MNKIKLNIAPKKMFLLKQISLLLATLFIFIMAVFAWFTGSDNPAKATGIQVTMTTNNTLLISLNDGKDFRSNIDLMDDDDQPYISADNVIKNVLNMKDITSDGKTFYRPIFSDNDITNERTPNVNETWDLAGNTTYISEKIVFRTTTPSNIFLGSGTTITTSAEKNHKLLSSSDGIGIGNKSKFGNFSLDCITGALRISAVNSNNNLVFVYIPRKDIEMTKTITDGVTKYKVKTGMKNVSSNTSVHKYFKSLGSETAPYYEEATSTNVVNSLDSTVSPIATTTFQNNGFYEATAVINIWLEGCDPETTRALSKGEYIISLDFCASEQ